jgi:hypothetical protein
MNLIFKTKDITGILELYDDEIVIKPSGILSMGRVERTLPFSSISRIEFKEAGLTSGYIRFVESSNSTPEISVWNAAKDINTFMYAQKRQNKVIRLIRNFVDIHLGDKVDCDHLRSSRENIIAELKNLGIGSNTKPNTILNNRIENTHLRSGIERVKPEKFPSNELASEVEESQIKSTKILSDKIIQKILAFVGWSLSAFSLVIALAGLVTPGAGKFLSIALLGWSLIFLPPLWRKTIKYGFRVNILTRIISFIFLPVFFMSLATANGYQPTTVAEVRPQNPSNKTVSPSPQTQVKKVPSTKPSATQSDLPIKSMPEKSTDERNKETFNPGISTVESVKPTLQKALTKYSFQQPSLFESGSAEKALSEYMLAWREKDWERMAKYTQDTWRSTESNPGEELSAFHDIKSLKGFEIIKVNRTAELVRDITYNIWYEIQPNDINANQVTARIIKEDGKYNPSASGKWGVNPDSTLGYDNTPVGK